MYLKHPDSRKIVRVKRVINVVDTAFLDRAIPAYLMTSKAEMQSPRTTGQKQEHLSKFRWFLQRDNIEIVDECAIQLFLQYIATAHMHPDGRWELSKEQVGSAALRSKQPVGRNTVRSYFTTLRAFFRWCLFRHLIESSPMEYMRPPTKEDRPVVPMEISQIDQLIEEAKRGRQPARDIAILYMLFDVGLRANELVALKVRDVDPYTNRVTVQHGKGDKTRHVFMGKKCAEALWVYNGARGECDPDDALFESRQGGHLQPNGLGQLIRKMGKRRGVTGVRCSPHTLRHSYGVTKLEMGCSDMYLMRSMGHSTMDSTKVYVNFVEGQMQRLQQAFSPADQLASSNKKRGRPRKS